MKLRLAGAIGVLALLCATTANASVMFYSDLASFTAVAPTYETINVPDVGLGTSGDGFDYLGTGDASVVYDSVTFAQSASLSNGNFFNVSSLFSGVRAVLSSNEQTIGVPNILITLPAPVDAFALDFGTFLGSAVTFTLSDGATMTFDSTGDGYVTSNFFGVTDTSGITSVLVTAAGTDDVLSVNGVSGVPEPATWAMMLTAFAGLGYAGYRRSRKGIAVTV